MNKNVMPNNQRMVNPMMMKNNAHIRQMQMMQRYPTYQGYPGYNNFNVNSKMMNGGSWRRTPLEAEGSEPPS